MTTDKCCIHCGKEKNENCNTNKSQKIEFKLFEQNTKTAKKIFSKVKVKAGEKAKVKEEEDIERKGG